MSDASLDPGLDPDWDDFRRWGAKIAGDLADHYAGLRDGPAWRPLPAHKKAQFYGQPVPREGLGFEAAYAEARELIVPHMQGNVHPRHWGWVAGSGAPMGVLGEFLGAGLNPNCTGSNHAATYTELQTLGWLKELLDFPAEATGLLVSGASIANLLGLACARHRAAAHHDSDWDLRQTGVYGGPRLMIYGSAEAHSCIQRSAEIFGLGRDSFRRIGTDAHYRMDLEALKRAIAEDRAQGHVPAAVVCTVGTVNTGATDPVEAIADLCQAENIWMHVDGAFGALAWLDPRRRPTLKGLQRADSLAFDCHKWLYIPYDIGCVFVRDPDVHYETFGVTPPYLSATRQGLSDSPFFFGNYGLDLSRPFRAMKLWMALKANGADAFARSIARNIDQGAYLAGLVEAHPKLRLGAEAPLNVVCFRYLAPGLDPAAEDALNRDLLEQLQASGRATPSMTLLDGRFHLRCAITNHRSRDEDFDILVDEVVRIGDRLLAQRA